MSLCVCPTVGLAVSIFVALVLPVASVSLWPFRPFFVVPSSRVCPIRPVRCCSSKRYLVAVPVSLWLLFGHSGLLRPLQSLRLYFGHSDHLCRHLYGSASSSPSVVFRSNPVACPAVSSVVLVVSFFVSIWPCLFGPSGRSSEMVCNCVMYVTIYVTIWSRLSILCLFSHFFFLSFCSSCLSGLFW